MNSKMTPSLLVAPLSMVSQPFETAVVVLADHEETGSMGFIVNRPTNLTIQDLLEDEQSKHANAAKQPVLLGGPVSKNSGFVLYEHEFGTPLAPGISLSETISISPARQLLEKAAAGMLSGRFELLLGYASWSRGQLHQELKRGNWLHVPFFEEIVFDVPHQDRWNHTYERLGISPFGFMQVPGGAHA